MKLPQSIVMPLTPALICGGPRPHPEQQLIQGPIGGTGSQSTCQSFGGRRLYYRDGSSGRGGNWVVVLPKATTQVIGPFHVISLANRCLDAVRRRVQSEQTGHRGRRDDPLYRARRVLLFAEERLDEQAAERLWSLLELGDPGGEVAIAYRSKERVRDFYRSADADEARSMLEELQTYCLKRAMPPEVQGSRARSRTGSTRSSTFTWPGLQPDQTDQAHRLRVPQPREISHPRPALRRPTNWRVLGSFVFR